MQKHTIGKFSVTFQQHKPNPGAERLSPTIHIHWDRREIVVGYDDPAIRWRLLDGFEFRCFRPNIRSKQSTMDWLNSVAAEINTLERVYFADYDASGTSLIARFADGNNEYSDLKQSIFSSAINWREEYQNARV